MVRIYLFYQHLFVFYLEVITSIGGTIIDGDLYKYNTSILDALKIISTYSRIKCSFWDIYEHILSLGGSHEQDESLSRVGSRTLTRK